MSRTRAFSPRAEVIAPCWQEARTGPCSRRRWKAGALGLVFVLEFLGLHAHLEQLRPSRWISVATQQLSLSTRFLGALLAVIAQYVAEIPRRFWSFIANWIWPLLGKLGVTFVALLRAILDGLWQPTSAFLSGYLEMSAARWSVLMSTLLVVAPILGVLTVFLEVVGMKKHVKYIRISWVLTKLFTNPLYDVSWTFFAAYTQTLHFVSHLTTFVMRFIRWLAPWITPYLELFNAGAHTVVTAVAHTLEAPLRGMIDGCSYIVAHLSEAKKWWLCALGVGVATVASRYAYTIYIHNPF